MSLAVRLRISSRIRRNRQTGSWVHRSYCVTDTQSIGVQDAVKMSHDLAHGDSLRSPGQQVPASFASRAVDPAACLQFEHDVLEERLGDVVPLGHLPDRNRTLAVMLHQREEHPQGIVRLHREFHVS